MDFHHFSLSEPPPDYMWLTKKCSGFPCELNLDLKLENSHDDTLDYWKIMRFQVAKKVSEIDLPKLQQREKFLFEEKAIFHRFSKNEEKSFKFSSCWYTTKALAWVNIGSKDLRYSLKTFSKCLFPSRWFAHHKNQSHIRNNNPQSTKKI